MKRFFLKLVILGVGISAGIYASSKIGILGDVINDIGVEDNIFVNEDWVYENEKYSNNLVLIPGVYDGFIIDLKYATKDNITKSVLYEKNLAYLQKNTLDKLIQVNEELKVMGYKLKIWDAYRPLSVQKKLWAVLPNSNYIANPFADGSNHNRGTAVDVTLVYKNGDEVEMPTKFDDFSGKSRRGSKWSSKARANVDLLTEIMEKHGFTSIDSEWWHFDDIDSKKYDVMDYKFRDLIKK